jgi:hypothetical protein
MDINKIIKIMKRKKKILIETNDDDY